MRALLYIHEFLWYVFLLLSSSFDSLSPAFPSSIPFSANARFQMPDSKCMIWNPLASGLRSAVALGNHGTVASGYHGTVASGYHGAVASGCHGTVASALLHLRAQRLVSRCCIAVAQQLSSSSGVRRFAVEGYRTRSPPAALLHGFAQLIPQSLCSTVGASCTCPQRG